MFNGEIVLKLVGGLEHCLFAISYMGCHPSHWRTHHFSRWLKHVKTHQPVKSCQVLISAGTISSFNMFQWLNYHFYGPISPIFAGVTDPQSQAFLARDLSNNELVVMKQAIFWERQRTVEGVIGFVFWDFFHPERKVVKQWSPGFLEGGSWNSGIMGIEYEERYVFFSDIPNRILGFRAK